MFTSPLSSLGFEISSSSSSGDGGGEEGPAGREGAWPGVSSSSSGSSRRGRSASAPAAAGGRARGSAGAPGARSAGGSSGRRGDGGSGGSSRPSPPDPPLTGVVVTTIKLEGGVGEITEQLKQHLESRGLTKDLKPHLDSLGQSLEALDSEVSTNEGIVPLVYFGRDVHTAGCAGLMLRASSPAVNQATATREDAAAALPVLDAPALSPAAAAHAGRVMFGSDRFAALHFPPPVWHQFQPPHTDAPPCQGLPDPPGQEGVWLRAPGVRGPGVWVTPPAAPPPAAVGAARLAPASSHPAADPASFRNAGEQAGSAITEGSALPSTCTPLVWKPVDCLPPNFSVSPLRHPTASPSHSPSHSSKPRAGSSIQSKSEKSERAREKSDAVAMEGVVQKVCGEGLPRPVVKGRMPRVPLFNLGGSFVIFTGARTGAECMPTCRADVLLLQRVCGVACSRCHALR